MIEEEYEVVVVGGGPAGLRTSWKLAEKGVKVLCIDKKQEIGVPVRCGEGISKKVFKDLNIPVNEKWIAQEIEGATVFSPDGNSVEIEEGTGYIIERKIFEKFLAEYASEAGARIIANSQAEGLIQKEGEIKGVEVKRDGKVKEVNCDLVVGADGIDSKIGKKAGIKTHSPLTEVDSGFQYEMTNVNMENPRTIKIYFDKEKAPRGYCWIFPKSEKRANIGIGIGGGQERTAKSYLDEWIEENPKKFENASIIEVNSGGIPVGGFLDDMVSDRMVLVGDAARQVNPIHGGGLREGMMAGDIAADVIKEALDEDRFDKEFLKKYEDRWWEERGNRLKKVVKLRQALEDIDNEDLNVLAKELSGEDIVDFSKGKNLTKLGKIALKTLGARGSAKLLLG